MYRPHVRAVLLARLAARLAGAVPQEVLLDIAGETVCDNAAADEGVANNTLL